jgi:hypothetical protein
VLVGGALEPGGIGTLNITDGGKVTTEDLKTWAGGTVNLNGGTLRAPSLNISEGNFNMTGGRLATHTVIGNLTVAGGSLAPGDLGGYTVVAGNYTQSSGAILEIGIGGSLYTAYDQLAVAGNATLGGLLQLFLLDGFIPSPSDSFVVLVTYGGLSGAFSNVANGNRLFTTDGTGSFLVNYGPSSTLNPNQVILNSFQRLSLPGDYNGDAVVDAADYVVWRNSRGQAGTGLAADGDGDGVVDEDDYQLWRACFGQTAASSATDSVSAFVAVPEPTSLRTFATVLLILLVAVRQRVPIPRLFSAADNTGGLEKWQSYAG